MKVILFGATGMIGQGVLRECLLDPGVESVLSIGRSPAGVTHQKLRDIVHKDLWHYEAIERQMKEFDACFFCLGVASSGMSEHHYERITYGIPVAAGETLAKLNSQMTFVLVSGASADSTENGRVMWARIKGKAENAVLRMRFKAAYVFRPGFIEPVHGAVSRIPAYRIFYRVMKPVMPVLRWMFPSYVLTTELIGLAMLKVVREGASKRVLESKDIRAVLG
jgi:uncharacterized protein YbjT (DUF2867 family)